MGNIGFPEMMVIFVIALLVFGPKRLPDLGRSLGRGLTEFRKASTDLKRSVQREIDLAELENSIAGNPERPSEGKHLDAPKS